MVNSIRNSQNSRCWPRVDRQIAHVGYLAKHYQTAWVPEYAREYCEKLTEPPTWQDEINMFHGQLALEAEVLPQGK
jgi:hypothetical protein